MAIELTALLAGVGEAVQQAQTHLERQAVEQFCSYFSAGEGENGVALAPASRQFLLPDPKEGVRRLEAAEAALVHHNTMTLDTVRVQLNILPRLEDDSRLLVEVGPAGEEVDPAYSRLELTFRGASAAEGVARLNQRTIQTL